VCGKVSGSERHAALRSITRKEGEAAHPLLRDVVVTGAERGGIVLVWVASTDPTQRETMDANFAIRVLDMGNTIPQLLSGITRFMQGYRLVATETRFAANDIRIESVPMTSAIRPTHGQGAEAIGTPDSFADVQAISQPKREPV